MDRYTINEGFSFCWVCFMRVERVEVPIASAMIPFVLLDFFHSVCSLHLRCVRGFDYFLPFSYSCSRLQ